MIFCRQFGRFSLRDIADAFGIEQYTTVASTIERNRHGDERPIRRTWFEHKTHR
jgi:chromosomal replication initiation ATPase DnaA